MATRPIEGYFRKAYQDYSGGISNFNSSLIIKQNQFSQLTNALVNNTGILEKAPGYSLDGSPFTNTSASFIRMLVNYRRGTTVDKLVCAALQVANTNATYKVDLKETSGDGSYAYFGHTLGTDASFINGNAAVVGVGTTWLSHLKAGDKIKASAHTDAMYTEIASVNNDLSITLVGGGYLGATAANAAYIARKILNKDYLPSAIVFNNNLVITNGSDTLMTYNNTTLNNITDADAPKGKFICAHKSRVFIAGTSGGLSSIYWSAVNDETSWDAAAFEIIFANDNGNICGIKSYADSLIVLKDNGNIYQVVGSFDQDATGEPDYIRRIDTPTNIGMLAGFSAVVNEDNKLYFLAESGVYALDQRMNLVKTSWNVETTIRNLSLSSGIVADKAFTFDSSTQWSTGSADGFRVNTSGQIENYYDYQQITGAKQADGCSSVFIDSTNIVHVAYISNNGRYLKYGRWLENGTYTTETAMDAQAVTGGSSASDVTGIFDGCSIAVSTSGLIGIACRRYLSSTGFIEHHFAERTAGTWASAIVNASSLYVTSAMSMSCSYTSGNSPEIAASEGNSSGGSGPIHYTRSGAIWSSVTLDSIATTNIAFLIGTGANRYMAGVGRGTKSIYYYTSADSGATWSAATLITASSDTIDYGVGGLSLVKDAVGDIIISWTKNNGIGDDGKLYKRNITRTTTTTVDSAITNKLKGYCSSNGGDFYYTTKGGYEKFSYDILHSNGTSAQFVNGNTAVVGVGTQWLTWVSVGDKIRLAADDETKLGTVLTVNSNTSITLTATYTGSSATGAYLSKRNTSLTQTSSGTLSDTYRQGDRAIHANSNTFATAAFGGNAEEIVVRRISFKAEWISAEQTDSTLSAWGTYDVADVSLGGNTITHEVALSTITGPTAYTTITNGALISTSASLIFAKVRITAIMVALAPASVGSVVLNYVGLGVGNVLPVGIVFNNEYYLSYASSGETSNSGVLLLDRARAWTIVQYPVMFMTRYRGLLYAGSSTTGDIYKLLQGYRFISSAYTLTATTKEDLLGSLELEKEVYKVYVIYKIQSSGTFDFSYRTNSFATSGGSSWVTTSVDQTTAGLAEIPGISGLMKSIQFKIESDDLDAQLGIIGFVILYSYVNTR